MGEGNGRLKAEWFWTDRWRTSRGFTLPLEARGLYREMLTQAWSCGARLPRRPDMIRRAVGATLPEWRRSWPLVKKFWRVDGAFLVNDTQLEIYKVCCERAERLSNRGRLGAEKRWI